MYGIYISTPIEETYGEGIELFRDSKHLICVEIKQPKHPIEIDPELGLEVVEKPTIQEKYGIILDPENSFHASVQRFFDKNGFITDKQLNCFK